MWLYLACTACIDLFILYSTERNQWPLGSTAREIVSILGRVVPAIPYSAHVLTEHGFTERIVPYQTLIAVNWLSICAFLCAATILLYREVSQNRTALSRWIENAYPPMPKNWTEDYGLTRIVAWGAFLTVLFLSFFGYVFGWLLAGPLPYLFLVYWCVFSALFMTALNLLLFGFIRLFRARHRI